MKVVRHHTKPSWLARHAAQGRTIRFKRATAGIQNPAFERFALWLPCHYLLSMPPRRKDTPKKLAARMRSWRVTILRNKAHRTLAT